ncbi:endonuclease domain-containing protein [Streptomyces sp. NPDC088353]|uniref:endonuclease domain-containing protein n=1 Tax=Streptomyces sp. NPDC088353 TaxID=3365855 RepID=UPI00381C1C7E
MERWRTSRLARSCVRCGEAVPRAAFVSGARPPARGLGEGLCGSRFRASAVHVDHRREAGRVRGVMCINCNSGLGLLRDDPEAVDRAADYPEGNAWKPTLVAPGVYRPPS